jgi:glycosyltransferase involved in cell wall biosynthesis
MSTDLLSIVVPAFNEEKTLPHILESLFSLQLDDLYSYEIILVDDASTDLTYEVIKGFLGKGLIYIKLPLNSGKGAAVKCGIKNSNGEFVLIQDADSEYFPSDIPNLLRVALDNPGASVYGSRHLGARNLSGLRKTLAHWPNQSILSWGFNFFLTYWLFILSRKWVTDTLTGYKLYPKILFQEWLPETTGFETDHEITSFIIRNKQQIIEVPIKYNPRSRSEGKKIKARDAIKAIRAFWVYRK